MSGLFGKKPPTMPRQPQVDDAIARRNEGDQRIRRGRATTILTSSDGLPNLGATARPAAYGG